MKKVLLITTALVLSVTTTGAKVVKPQYYPEPFRGNWIAMDDRTDQLSITPTKVVRTMPQLQCGVNAVKVHSLTTVIEEECSHGYEEHWLDDYKATEMWPPQQIDKIQVLIVSLKSQRDPPQIQIYVNECASLPEQPEQCE